MRMETEQNVSNKQNKRENQQQQLYSNIIQFSIQTKGNYNLMLRYHWECECVLLMLLLLLLCAPE